MPKWFRSLFAWRRVGIVGVWVYFENSITGRREAYKLAELHGPRDEEWLAGKKDDLFRISWPKNPPNKGTAGTRE